jgi:carbamoyltransferase
MKILSISAAHDSGACLYEDGKIVYFFKEERLSKRKRDKFPLLSVNKILELVDGNIDIVVFCPVISGEDFTLNTFLSILNKNGHDTNNIEIINLENDHHLQHASLAFYNSGFDEANVLVVDRNGSMFFEGCRESETIFYASYPDNFKILYKNFWLYDNFAQEKARAWSVNNDVEVDINSLFGIVKVYEAATTLIGENALENGKTMGLSAYGNKNKNKNKYFVNKTNIPNDFYFSHASHPFGDYQTIFKNHYEITQNEFSENNYSEYADLAWQVQKQTQEAVKYLIEKSLQKQETKNIVITGGYGLNVVANQFLLKSFPNKKFYFEPLADDSGNCIGGAMLAYRNKAKDKKKISIKNTFFHGKKYSLDHIVGNECQPPDVAKMIIDNKSIAIYNGLSEAGPRSLGNRSILFNAMNPNAKKIINIIKKREWYRPFALSVLEEDAHKYFDMLNLKNSKFMTISFDAFEETKKLFPGVVHVDGTCRIQTVNKDDGVLFSILSEIKLLSGHGVVLNTSFNLAGEPLVETPQDAINVLNNSLLDGVWFAEIEKIVMNMKVQ